MARVQNGAMQLHHTHRRDAAISALQFFLDGLVLGGLHGVAVSTREGVVIARAGALEGGWLALGLIRGEGEFRWKDRLVRVHHLSVNELDLVLTTSGPAAPREDLAAEELFRIFARS